MKDIVVISTSPGREDWVKEILGSITRPVVVISDFGYELGKIKWVFENTNCDRFLFLQDSLVVRDESLFDLVFESPGSSCIMDVPSCFGSYMGVYERTVLSKIEIPMITTKEESIFHEIDWTRRYVALCEKFSHPVNVVHKEIETVRKFGRENLLYVNQFYEKWKGDWGVPVKDYESISNPVELERVNLQMLEKSRLIQDLTNKILQLTTNSAGSNELQPPESNFLREATEKIDLANAEIASLRSDLKSNAAELLAIRESTIWKLFGPYRWILDSIRHSKQ